MLPLTLLSLTLLAGLTLLSVLLLTLLATLRTLAARALALLALVLPVLEGLIAQILLLAGELVEFVGLLAHLAAVRIGFAARLRGLEVLQGLAKLVQQPLRLGGVAALHRLGHVVEHLVEVVGRDGLGVRIRRALLALGLAVLALALGHALHELVQGLLQVLGELLDLLVRRVALDGLLQAVLSRAQALLGIGEIAVLDLEGHLPEEIGHLHQGVVVAGRPETTRGRLEAEEDARLRREAVGRDQEGVEGGEHPAAALVRARDQAATLLRQRARQGLGEDPGRQRHLGGLRAALLSGLVLHDQRQANPCPGPGIVGEVDQRLGVVLARGVGGQRQGDLRRRHQDARAGEGLDEALGGGDAVIVLGPVGQVEGAARIDLKTADAAHFGGGVGNGLDDEVLGRRACGGDGEVGDAAGELEAVLAQVGVRRLAR